MHDRRYMIGAACLLSYTRLAGINEKWSFLVLLSLCAAAVADISAWEGGLHTLQQRLCKPIKTTIYMLAAVLASLAGLHV